MVLNPCSTTAVLVALCSEVTRDPSTTTWSVSVDSCVKLCDQSLPLPEATKPEHNKVFSELEGLAVELWNYSVAIKTKGAVTNSSNAKIRYVAFLVLDCCEQKDNSDHYGKRLIMMQVNQIWQRKCSARLKSALKVYRKVCLREIFLQEKVATVKRWRDRN
ncbi:hypothetical protein DPMN_055029 [Dreissena polymorpha]|uniref:Uncharacterized protein n=1 Tax=Dreissena polymorpha TaxID=45954 RepID=A0A9D4CRW5_DREPO|nr:hypothetical protein DPMN_055029 [Dreissena polymorpha]